jgi:hypothetical protein
VWLGNPDAVVVVKLRDADGNPVVDDNGVEKTERRKHPAGTWTCVGVHPDLDLATLVRQITDPQGIWAYHSDAERPSWVASEDPRLARALAPILGCPVAPIPADAY